MGMRILTFILLLFMYGCSLTVPKEVEVKYDEIPEKVDFNYHVKPILSDRCYSCHGPDEKSRRAGLRLDQEKTAFMKLSSGRTAIDPGNISGSEMAHRILSDDPDEVMPPPNAGDKLNPEQINTIKQWISEGGKYEKHWSYQKPKRPVVPNSNFKASIKNPIDNFIHNIVKSKYILSKQHVFILDNISKENFELIQ